MQRIKFIIAQLWKTVKNAIGTVEMLSVIRWELCTKPMAYFKYYTYVCIYNMASA